MKKEKKVIPEQTAVKAIITGIVSYGILIWFLIAVLVIFLKYISKKTIIQNQILYNCILSLIGFVIIFFLVRLTVKLANFDLFKKCKFNKEKEKYVLKKLNIFFIICTIFFALAITTGLYIKFSIEKINIEFLSTQYKNDLASSTNVIALAEHYKTTLEENYRDNLINTLSFSLIISLGTIYSLFSLIPYQKKLLEMYNVDPKHQE